MSENYWVKQKLAPVH